MNLKEAFRYQNFLDEMMMDAEESLRYQTHHLITKKNHLRSKANESAADYEEVVDVPEFTPDDDVVEFVKFLIDEKTLIGTEISKAKASAEIDIDAAVAANKYRQRLCNSISNILKCKVKKSVEKGQDYRFNNEGVQMPYFYDIEVTTVENFDRAKMKETLRALADKADAVSTNIDSVMVNTMVAYEPILDVNGYFEDAIEAFLKWREHPTG